MSAPHNNDPQDPIHNQSLNLHFQHILSRGLANPQRRRMLVGSLGLASLSVAGWPTPAGAAQGAASELSFNAVAKSLVDDVVLPPGYEYRIIHATGDALSAAISDFSAMGIETDDFSQRIGDHHDGLDIFFIDEKGNYTEKDTGRALLVVNHESSADAAFLHANGQTSGGRKGLKFDQFGEWDGGERPMQEVLKEINLHGVSISEIRRTKGQWAMVKKSPLNRRITPETPARVTGPSAQLQDIRNLLATRFSPTGVRVRGTINNCGMGRTPWGTYLTCEENFFPYFGRTEGPEPDAKTLIALKRYGLPMKSALDSRNSSQGWHTVSGSDEQMRFARWNLAWTGKSAKEDFRNEANSFGYVTEIDPARPKSAPTKRIALGRFVHEAAVFSQPIEGEPLAVYMGCDGRNEYIYKFVSKAKWSAKDQGAGTKAGDKYLTEGQLYAARFNDDGSGQWILLSIQNPAIKSAQSFSFTNEAEVMVFARLAADAAGATPMDRPEWGARNPVNNEIYFALTNNSDRFRVPGKTNAANPRAYSDADGKKRSGNPNGHIIRFKENNDSASATDFRWDIFLFGAEEDAGEANLSRLTAANSFSSPDGLWFSQATKICWIQTDDGAMTDESNCMLLAAIPGQVGDGAAVEVNNKMGTQSGSQKTFVGATLGEGRLRRFLVAPLGAEVTGLTETPDGKALFVNIQHPGEDTKSADLVAERYQSNWPGNKGYGRPGRPRSATIVITRTDGGVIGL
jgi:secreted PhoX family phosphatase